MIQIPELVDALSLCLERKIKLAECRREAQGDVEYYAFGYIQDMKLAEAELERVLASYIDQRVAKEIAVEQITAAARNDALPRTSGPQ